MAEAIQVEVNGKPLEVAPGTTAAVALFLSGSGAPLCGMGICFACCAEVDGRAHVRTCQVVCKPGMKIHVD